MPDFDFPTNLSSVLGEELAGLSGLPAPLPGDPRRQAVPSIQGTVYQAWVSIDAWLRLANADEAIFLEGAEDFDIMQKGGAIAVQVKRNVGTISLGTAKATEALENFWTLSNQQAQRHIEFHYLTTSSIASERDSNFGGAKGIEVWRVARTNPDLAEKIRKYLVTRLNEKSPLRAFLESANAEEVQNRLIQRFQWLTDQPDIDIVKRSVDDRIAVLLDSHRRPSSLVPYVRKHLESRFWEIILEPVAVRRCLTLAELLRQVESATTTYLPVPVDKLPDLLGDVRPGLGLLGLLLEKIPQVPEPLLRRDQLTESVGSLVKDRKAVLLTGTVYKGKTTVAQLVSLRLCPDSWWVNLSGRQAREIDNVFLALSSRIENEDCPDLVIIDDLDISPAAYRVYRDSLGLVLHRASSAGHGIIITAQGSSDNSVVSQDFKGIVTIEIPELGPDEIKALCIVHGCPQETSSSWGSLISAWTGGHPKLVQVRLGDLADRGWPKPQADDLIIPLPAVSSVRAISRQLLNSYYTDPVVEFVYLMSAASGLLHRSVAIKLSESVEGLGNGGDVLDNLSGKWLERIEGQWFRTTALLSGVMGEVWSPEKCKWAHICLHDAIRSKGTLAPFEGAQLLFHAFLGREPQRLALTAMCFQILDDKVVRREVERQLLWLPLLALEPGQSIVEDALAGAILRRLQFQVACTLDSETLPKICARWAEDVDQIQNPKAKELNKAIMWLSMGWAENPRIPLKFRLGAILAIPTLSSEVPIQRSDYGKSFFEEAHSIGGLPESGTTAQAILLNASRNVRGRVDLRELLRWLDEEAPDDVRQQFDEMLGWRFTQDMGAFVQGAWAAEHEQTEDWQPWISLLEDIEEYSKRRSSPRFGSEAAKAKAIILTEYLGRGEEALRVLDDAEAAFGSSTVLMVQRANTLFQADDDEPVLKIWDTLTINANTKATLDPFAYRRAAMSAAKLEQWSKSAQIFKEAANSIKPGMHEYTRFGLMIDAAMSMALGGMNTSAAKLLADTVLQLPVEAENDGNIKWDALQRTAVEVHRTIEKRLWEPMKAQPRFTPGYASSPDLKVPTVEPGQAVRSEMTRVQVLNLLSTLTAEPDQFGGHLEELAVSKYFFVRWTAVQARLALKYSKGAGAGFVEALLAFDNAFTDFTAYMQAGVHTLLEPGTGPPSARLTTPERWFGLLSAGAVCSGPDLLTNLDTWLTDSRKTLGEGAPLTQNIQLLLNGASLPEGSLESILRNESSATPLRCGAATRLLQEDLTAEKTFLIQAFMASAFMSDESSFFQPIFNIHITRHFSNPWRALVQNPFHFYSPRTSIPNMLYVLNEVEKGGITLKRLLISAANALRKPLGEFTERLL